MVSDVEKIPKFVIGDKVNAYEVQRVIIPNVGPICYMVKCKCAKSFKIVQATLINSKMCRTCIAQIKASKPRPQPDDILGTYRVIRLAYDGKTNDERRYDCICVKCQIKTFVSERNLQNKRACSFCKY